MADQIPSTDPQNPGGTDGQPGGTPPAAPAATPQDGGGSAGGEEETITLNKSDYAKLVGQRDSNHQELSTAMGFIERQAQKEGIEKFLSEHKEDYPDLSNDDLSHVDDPNNLEAEAKRIQARLSAHAQAKILEIENPSTPRESPEARAAREAKLAENPGPTTWEEVLAGRMNG